MTERERQAVTEKAVLTELVNRLKTDQVLEELHEVKFDEIDSDTSHGTCCVVMFNGAAFHLSLRLDRWER